MAKLDKHSIIKRIKQLRIQYAGERGRSKFAQAIDLTPSTYSYYEHNRLAPIETLLKICRLTGYDLQWLLTGEKKSDIIQQKTHLSKISSDLLAKMSDILSEDAGLATTIDNFLELLIKKNQLKKELDIDTVQTSQPTAPVISPVDAAINLTASDSDTNDLTNSNAANLIPILGRTAAGIVHCWPDELLPTGDEAVTELSDLINNHFSSTDRRPHKPIKKTITAGAALPQSNCSGQTEFIQINSPHTETLSAEFIRHEQIKEFFPDCFGLRIDGDSMSPKIEDGDIVLLSPSVPATQGQIAIIKIKKQIGVTCKLVRYEDNSAHLIAINEKYPTKTINQQDILWSLSVLYHVRM